jgi:hypothetical protein
LLIAGTYGGGVFISYDSGASWAAPDSGLTNPDVISLCVCDTNASTPMIFAGTDGSGIFLSKDNGVHWNPVNDGLTDASISSLAVSGTTASTAMLFAGTSGSGVWRRPLSQMTGASAVELTPSLDCSIGVSPNPFTQSATISLPAPVSGPAEITIVNLLGSEVARIFSGEIAQGEHDFTWNANGMAPGMYECIVQMNGLVKRAPMILAR